MKTKQILTAGAIALSMILTGCSNSSNTKDTKTSEVTKKKEEKKLGQKTKDSKSLKFTNNTGKKITVFETKSSSEENFSDNLLEDGDAVKNKEERTLYYDVKENDKLDVKIGLQNEDKTFVFKDVDTTDAEKVDVSLKEDEVNLDVTKKDGSTATLTPSEDSAKTEDEKKEEQEVKQEEKKEEKKEETAEADSSNKSNTSESKKDNTASTTNTGSNKNNTSSSSSKPSNSGSNNSGTSKPSNNSGSNSSSSKPAEHTHDWVAVTETRTVVDQPAYDEQVPVTEMKEHEICNQCGADLTGLDIDAHFKNSYFNGGNCGGFHSEWREEVTGYQTVHHDAVTHTETVTTGYRCSTCGATK